MQEEQRDQLGHLRSLVKKRQKKLKDPLDVFEAGLRCHPIFDYDLDCPPDPKAPGGLGGCCDCGGYWTCLLIKFLYLENLELKEKVEQLEREKVVN